MSSQQQQQPPTNPSLSDELDECCANCDYYFHHGGECHRYPPLTTSYEFPMCNPTQWCGEWKAKKR